MKRYLLAISCLLFARGEMDAQNNIRESFDSFRKGLNADYQNFRKTIFDDYYKYLDGVWKEFDALKGNVRDKTPKPHVLPDIDSTPATKPEKMPEPEVKKNPSKPTSPTVNTKPTKPEPLVIPTHNPDDKVPKVEKLSISFYGMFISLPKSNIIRTTSDSPSSIAATWKGYLSNGSREIVKDLTKVLDEWNANDWIRFDLVRSYVDQSFKQEKSMDRLILQHFFLTAMGFDTRLAKTDRQCMLLIPFKQMCYGRSYLSLDGQNYYIFLDNINPVDESELRLYTCEIPKDVNKGRKLDLTIMNGMNLTYGNRKYSKITDGTLTIEANVNETMMKMLNHYPQMDVSGYASSCVETQLHHSLIEQLKPQIQGIGQVEVVNRLMNLIQNGFAYATDDEQHGFEKPYFIEENFYYPKNDCEDRSILLAFLVKGLLGLDVHLVQFPGHECTAIHFTENINYSAMDTYNYGGKTYVIADPTYIGASTGMCMPQFKSMQPKVELW